MNFEQYSPQAIPNENLTIPFLKQHLQEFGDWQVEQFKAKKHINKIVEMRARYVDELLMRLWDLVGLNESFDLSLLAVGGYGRGELHPKSDIDLLILSDHGFSKESEEKIWQLITLLKYLML